MGDYVGDPYPKATFHQDTIIPFRPANATFVVLFFNASVSGPAFSSPAFSTPAFTVRRSSIFRSYIFHPALLVLHFPVLHFPVPHFPVLHFSILEIWSLIFQWCRSLFDLSSPSLVSHFPVLHFQSTRFKDNASQRKSGKFDPRLPPKTLIRSSPKFAWVITSETPTPKQHFITIRLSPFAPQICEYAHQKG